MSELKVRLRCLRCGDLAYMDPFEMYGWGLCSNCWRKHPDASPDARHFFRWCDRYQKCGPAHPTWRVLAVVVDAFDTSTEEVPW